jgi:hypothetical protein
MGGLLLDFLRPEAGQDKAMPSRPIKTGLFGRTHLC